MFVHTHSDSQRPDTTDEKQEQHCAGCHGQRNTSETDPGSNAVALKEKVRVQQCTVKRLGRMNIESFFFTLYVCKIDTSWRN